MAKKKIDPRLVTDPQIIAAAEELAGNASSMLSSTLGSIELYFEVDPVYWADDDDEDEDEEADGDSGDDDAVDKAQPNQAAAASPSRNVLVSWVSWEHDGEFRADLLDGLSANGDTVEVSVEGLLSGSAANYGLGPEFDFESADTSPMSTNDPPDEVLDALAMELESRWESEILEYPDEEEIKAIVAKWPTQLRKVGERIIAAREKWDE